MPSATTEENITAGRSPPPRPRPRAAPPAARGVDARERSDEEIETHPSVGQSKTQRIAKACDKCRKSKSKCEPSPTEGEPCKSCAATNSECAYTAPTFRRGPPKGYIQALEHRLHQVESVLAAIMSSSDLRVQTIIDELAQDDLAAYILETVDAGPFGRTGREKRAIDTSKDNFFASIVTEQPLKTTSHRSRRQSRATREGVIETVIATDPQIQSTRPTLAWQDRLSARLTSSTSPPADAADDDNPMPPRTAAPSPPPRLVDCEPPRARRRLVGPASPGSAEPDPPALPVPRKEDDLGDCAEAFGNLSIDENREVRYHGNASGLQLLALAERNDDRNAKGIWMFPMAKFWTGNTVSASVNTTTAQREYIESLEQAVNLPPIAVQDHLVQVFFTYVNPSIPVVDEEDFMHQYNAQKYGYGDHQDGSRATHPPASAADATTALHPERPQKLSMLLRLSMYAYAATLLTPQDRAPGELGDGPAAEYARCARILLDAMYHESRSSTVQALILLGMREYGIGSLEEGWLHIGMATRMALDLGLNRDSDKWMHNGREMFTQKEQSIRKRIWWACCLADKFSALFLGRTITIHEGDFSTPPMDVPEDDCEHMWRPCAPDPLCDRPFRPVPAMYANYFRHISSLYIITGEVLVKIYRVSSSSRRHEAPSRVLREELYERLLQWKLDLPERMNYTVQSDKPCPAPHILAMHIQYLAAVILVHRPFIPKGSDLARADDSPSLNADPVPWESYDICQSAANQIASFALLYHETYHMRWAPPFLSNCILAGGIVHIVTLRFKPLNTQASVGLQKSIDALAGMQSTWLTALRVRHLIKNAKVGIDSALASAQSSEPRSPPKRPARVAFEEQDRGPTQGAHRSSALSSSASASVRIPPTHRQHVPPASRAPRAPSECAPRDAPLGPYGYRCQPGERADIYAGYMPGYNSWWPVLDDQHPPPEMVHVCNTAPPGPAMAPLTAVMLPEHEFTFTQEHFSPDFLQAMRDPVIHFPSAFVRPF